MVKIPSQFIENPQTIGDHIKKRRQKALTVKIGVSEDCITYWENGRSSPQIQYYPKLIEFWGYNPWPVDDESIGGQIRRYRFEHGLNHKKLSKITGFDPATLASWEGKTHPPPLPVKGLIQTGSAYTAPDHSKTFTKT